MGGVSCIARHQIPCFLTGVCGEVSGGVCSDCPQVPCELEAVRVADAAPQTGWPPTMELVSRRMEHFKLVWCHHSISVLLELKINFFFTKTLIVSVQKMVEVHCA